MSSKLVESMLKNAGVIDASKSKDLLKKINEAGDVKVTRMDDQMGDAGAVSPDMAASMDGTSDGTSMDGDSDEGCMACSDRAEPVECPFCHEETGKGMFYDHMVDAHPEVMNINTQAKPDVDATGQEGDGDAALSQGPKNVELSFESKKDKREMNVGANLAAKHMQHSGAGAHDLKGGKKASRAKQKQEMHKDMSRMDEAAKKEKAETNTNFLTDLPKEWEKDKVEQNKNDSEKVFSVPAKVKSELKDVMNGLLKDAKDLKHEDIKSSQQAEDLADAIKDLLGHLDKGTVEEFKKAQVLATSLWSGMMHKLPDSFWDFIATGGWVSGDGKKAKDLKDYFNVVRAKEV